MLMISARKAARTYQHPHGNLMVLDRPCFSNIALARSSIIVLQV
jgi:hypothetical protein